MNDRHRVLILIFWFVMEERDVCVCEDDDAVGAVGGRFRIRSRRQTETGRERERELVKMEVHTNALCEFICDKLLYVRVHCRAVDTPWPCVLAHSHIYRAL